MNVELEEGTVVMAPPRRISLLAVAYLLIGGFIGMMLLLFPATYLFALANSHPPRPFLSERLLAYNDPKTKGMVTSTRDMRGGQSDRVFARRVRYEYRDDRGRTHWGESVEYRSRMWSPGDPIEVRYSRKFPAASRAEGMSFYRSDNAPRYASILGPVSGIGLAWWLLMAPSRGWRAYRLLKHGRCVEGRLLDAGFGSGVKVLKFLGGAVVADVNVLVRYGYQDESGRERTGTYKFEREKMRAGRGARLLVFHDRMRPDDCVAWPQFEVGLEILRDGSMAVQSWLMQGIILIWGWGLLAALAVYGVRVLAVLAGIG